MIITFFALAGAIVQVILYSTLFTVFLKVQRHRKIHGNPTTLEWTTPIERIHGNWPGDLPEVHRWAYDYSKPGAEDDFVPKQFH